MPSPNVAEDHQTKNARALSDNGAAILVTDAQARQELVPAILKTMADTALLNSMGKAIRNLSLPGSDEKIVDEISKIIAGK